MDDSTFDRLTRAVSAAGSRRRLLGLLTSVGLGGLLMQLDDEAAAERPGNRMNRRNQQRKRKQRNNKSKNNNKNNNKNKNKNKNKGGGLGDIQCGATDSDCSQNSDCCSNNCFNLGCAEKVHSCGSGNNATTCRPAANGCAGETCCRGAAVCNGACCDGTANQCNPQGACCVPNCAGRQCGDDGCGNGGTCGACSTGQTCDTTNGTCKGGPDNAFLCTCNNGTGVATCNAATCAPDGVRAVCNILCANHGGFGAGGSGAQCAPNSCTA